MRLVSIFLKSLREQARDRLALSLTLIFAPCMVVLYWVLFPSGSTTFNVLVINNDAGRPAASGSIYNAGDEVVTAIKNVTYKDGKPLLIVKTMTDRAQAETRLRNRDAAALLIIPADFSRSLQISLLAPAVTSTVMFVGDLTNSYYAPVMAMVTGALGQAMEKAMGWPSPVLVTEEALGASGVRSEFESYVPGLLIFAVIMLVFQAAMTVTAEVEAGTLRRLQLTHMTAFDLLGGTGAALVVVGVASLLLAFATALAIGFHSQGPLWVAILIAILTSISVIGTGLVVACFSKTVNQAFLIANFPLAILMFFSGSVFPIPRNTLFYLAGHSVTIFDILPPTHAVNALNKVMTLGSGLNDVLFEVGALAVLSLLYFVVGVWLFQRAHLRAQ